MTALFTTVTVIDTMSGDPLRQVDTAVTDLTGYCTLHIISASLLIFALQNKELTLILLNPPSGLSASLLITCP